MLEELVPTQLPIHAVFMDRVILEEEEEGQEALALMRV